MRWHDRRGGAQRAYCAQCDQVDSGRHPSLRGLKLGRGTAKRVAALVVQGLDEIAIIKRLGMSVEGAKRQLDLVVSQAQTRYAQAPPMVASGWQPITTPGGYIVAVGKQGNSFRILGWVEPGGTTLSSVVGSNTDDPPPSTGMAVWLTNLLAPGGQDIEEIERRLWIALAQTNRWIKD